MIMHFPPHEAMIMTHASVSTFMFIITCATLVPTLIMIIYKQTYTCFATSSTTTAITTLSCRPSNYDNEINHCVCANTNALDILLGYCCHKYKNQMQMLELEMVKGHVGRKVRKKGIKQK